MYTYTPSLLDLLPTPCPPTPLGHHRALSCAPCTIYHRFPPAICFTHGGVYISIPTSQTIPPSASSTVSTHPFSTFASLFLPCKLVHLYHFSRFHIYVLIRYLFFSFWLTSPCMTGSRSIHVSTNDPFSFLFSKRKKSKFVVGGRRSWRGGFFTLPNILYRWEVGGHRKGSKWGPMPHSEQYRRIWFRCFVSKPLVLIC